MPPEYHNKDLDFEYSNKVLCVNNYYGDGEHLKIKVNQKMVESIFGTQNIHKFIKWCHEPDPMSIPGNVWPVTLQTQFGGNTTTEVLAKLYCVSGLIYGVFKDQKEQTKNKYLYSHSIILFEKYLKNSTGRGKELIIWILNHLRKFRFLCNQKKVRFEDLHVSGPQIKDKQNSKQNHGSYAGYWVLIILLIIAIIYIYLRRL